jgi:hypothetical protein
MSVKKNATLSLDSYFQQVTATIDFATGGHAKDATSIIKFPSSYSVLDSVSLKVTEIQFSPRGETAFYSWDAIIAAARSTIRLGLSWLPVVPAYGFNPGSAGYLCHDDVSQWLVGAVVGVQTTVGNTLRIKFDHLAGGGLLCHPAMTYAWGVILGAATTQAFYITCTLKYSVIELDLETWQQLYQVQAIQQQL